MSKDDLRRVDFFTLTLHLWFMEFQLFQVLLLSFFVTRSLGCFPDVNFCTVGNIWLRYFSVCQMIKTVFVKKQRCVWPQSKQNASLSLFFFLTTYNSIVLRPFLQLFFEPFYFIICFFVGSGFLMLNEDQISKFVLISLHNTAVWEWEEVNGQEMLSSCVCLFDSRPPLCLWASHFLMEFPDHYKVKSAVSLNIYYKFEVWCLRLVMINTIKRWFPV